MCIWLAVCWWTAHAKGQQTVTDPRIPLHGSTPFPVGRVQSSAAVPIGEVTGRHPTFGEKYKEREIKRQREGLLVDNMSSSEQIDVAHDSGCGFIPYNQPDKLHAREWFSQDLMTATTGWVSGELTMAHP